MTIAESYDITADEFTFFAGFKDLEEALRVAEGLANDNPHAVVRVRTIKVETTDSYQICPTLGVVLTSQATTTTD